MKETRAHMHFHYDLNSWSRMYRQEALTEARKRHLAQQASGNSSRPLFSRVGNVGSILISGVLSALKW
jgi:hypothetical protein